MRIQNMLELKPISLQPPTKEAAGLLTSFHELDLTMEVDIGHCHWIRVVFKRLSFLYRITKIFVVLSNLTEPLKIPFVSPLYLR